MRIGLEIQNIRKNLKDARLQRQVSVWLHPRPRRWSHPERREMREVNSVMGLIHTLCFMQVSRKTSKIFGRLWWCFSKKWTDEDEATNICLSPDNESRVDIDWSLRYLSVLSNLSVQATSSISLPFDPDMFAGVGSGRTYSATTLSTADLAHLSITYKRGMDNQFTELQEYWMLFEAAPQGSMRIVWLLKPHYSHWHPSQYERKHVIKNSHFWVGETVKFSQTIQRFIAHNLL